MKAGWAVKRLGEMLQIQNGYAFSSKKFSYTSGTPLIRIRDLKSGNGTEVNFDDAYDPSYLVSRGDFLIGMDGEFRCYEWQGADALLNQRVCRLDDFADGLLPRFLLYGINKYLKEIEDFTAFTTVKHLSSKTIKSIEIPLPPLEEQQRIVALLDEAFEGLARSRAHAEANRENARELFDSGLRAIFEYGENNWTMRSLPSVCQDFGRGKSKHRPRNDPSLYGGTTPFLQTGDLTNADHWITDFSQTYSAKGVAQSKIWPSGTVCIAIVGATIGETGITSFDACFPDSVIGMTPNPQRASAEYINYMLRFYKKQLKKAGEGSARDNINLATFVDRLFPFPPVEQQVETIEKLNSMASESRDLQLHYSAKLQSLDALRQSLLQKAFAGELT